MTVPAPTLPGGIFRQGVGTGAVHSSGRHGARPPKNNGSVPAPLASGQNRSPGNSNLGLKAEKFPGGFAEEALPPLRAYADKLRIVERNRLLVPFDVREVG